LDFLRQQWLDQEQELITVIQEETKRTEEKEEAGYRSPTRSILQVLQKINKTKRIEGNVTPSLLSVCGTKRFKVLGRGWQTYCCSMGTFIGMRAGEVVGKDGQVETLGGLVQVEETRRRVTPV